MKTITTLLLAMLLHGSMYAELAYFGIHTSNAQIIGPCGDTIVLHGINYAPYNWGYDSTQLYLDQVAQSGANVVRMSWYSVSAAPYYTDALLDSAIGACIRNKMIPIIELHDNTCSADLQSLIQLANWYVTPAHKSIIDKYKANLIINIANEVGQVNWANNAVQAQADYQGAYDSIIRLFRNNDILVPLLIDAPDCGTSIDVFSNVADHLITNDTQHNLIFSAHAYWYAYANNDSATMRQKLTAAVSAGFPLVLGEVANQQDDANPCQYNLNYTALLHTCSQLNVGWLAWSWNNDVCPQRQVSTDGMFAHLSTYGNDIINNATYGLKKLSKLSAYLNNNQQACVQDTIPSAVDELNTTKLPYRVYFAGNRNYIASNADVAMQLQVYDLLGRLVTQATLYPHQTMALPGGFSPEMRLVQVRDSERSYLSKYFVQ